MQSVMHTTVYEKFAEKQPFEKAETLLRGLLLLFRFSNHLIDENWFAGRKCIEFNRQTAVFLIFEL